MERDFGDHLQQKNCLAYSYFFMFFFPGLSLCLLIIVSYRHHEKPRRFVSAKEYYHRELCHQCMRKRRRMAQLVHLVTWPLKFSLTHSGIIYLRGFLIFIW